MAKAKRTPKLKVFRTPIGFHDAYVAAPSQKAALDAWGVETNLFARGAAEQVTEAALMKVPLRHPGQVVKVARGTREEQLAALSKQILPKRSTEPEAEIVPKRTKKRGRKPSRSALERAEHALEGLLKRQAEQLAAVDKQVKALESRRRELQRRHERERDKAEEKLEDERADYESAVRSYESG